MITYEITLDENWIQIIDNEDYLLQNRTLKPILLKAQVIIPTDESASLKVEEGEWIHSALLAGTIWAKATDNPISVDAKITLAK